MSTHTIICSQQSCMSQCQQCLLSCTVLDTSFQLLWRSGSSLKFTGPPFPLDPMNILYHSCSSPAMMKFYTSKNKMHAILSTKVGLLLTVLRWKTSIPSPRIHLFNALSLSECWQPARETQPTSESKRELKKMMVQEPGDVKVYSGVNVRILMGVISGIALLMTPDEYWTKNCG